MDLPDASRIVLRGETSTVAFLWRTFDGDDGFDEHAIEIHGRGSSTRYEFGGCVVAGLRKLSKFLDSPLETSVHAGFRNPMAMDYHMERSGADFILRIDVEGK
ncbi:MAG: hypothetical protein EHM91_17945, partial [Planctomycetota bacterium]